VRRAFVSIFAAMVVLAFAGTASAQTAGRICSTIFSTLATSCGVGADKQMLVKVTDCSTEACTAGGGSIEVILHCDGATCNPVSSGSSLVRNTNTNGDFIDNTPDGGFTFTIDEAGPATITCADTAGACPLTIDAGTDGPITIGSADVDTLTVTLDGTGDAEVVLPLEVIGAGEIVNPVRAIPLPLGSWVPCAGSVAGIWDASGADTEPDLVAAPAGTPAIVYDDTGGSVDADTICNSFTVPADYVSGGAFRARVTQDGATTNIETFSCAISVDGAAVGATNAGNNADQTAVQTVTSTPAGTWAAGASIQVACSQGNASADDTVNFHSIEAFYTATQ
jgi:hypothetical protein